MKSVTSYRGASALLFLSLVLFLAVFPQDTLSANGSQETVTQSVQTVEQNAQQAEKKILLRSEPAVKPEWVDYVTQSSTEFFFVGTSQPYDTAANARDNARENARNQVLKFTGEFIETRAIGKSSISGVTGETLAAYINREDMFQSFAQNIVSQVAASRYYTEVYLNSNNKEEYIVYVLCEIGRQKAEDEIVNFAKNTSERYANLLSQGSTLKSVLESYSFIVKTLEQNPLHRMVAYYDSPAGRAGLYEYVRLRINELASSLTIESVPSRAIQETEKLNTLINPHSSVMYSTGLLDCKASLFGIGDDDVNFTFITSSEDPFNLEVNNLRAGSYNVQIEILLSALTGGIVKNAVNKFSFEVTPLNLYIDNADAMEAGIKRAVDALASGLQTETETKIGPFFLSGTNVPSGLSLYLYERIRHYAINNSGKKYQIAQAEIDEAVSLAGFFTRRGDRVDVILELTTPQGKNIGSQGFSLSITELQRRNITIEPENMLNIAELNKTLNELPNNPQINIQAYFNSESLTYKHRDELKMTVTADRDCFFKVYHIDVNNDYRMIYPVGNHTPNSLRANESRTVFQDGRYFLYAPYGNETLIVVVSNEQFKNMEQEYNAPWTAVTEALNDSLSGMGEARYSISILKPHEEYEFKRPQNMTQTYQAIRDDTVRQGGYFEGNETSGFYILNNIRGSYRVLRDTDMIQFAEYYLDNYSRGSNTAVMTRGGGYNFSFIKPQDITQAVQSVRGGIESKGGIFTGNEQQGSFKAEGIAGQYRISDIVNVTITEKPFIIPNSLIEREVKNFFNVR